MEFMHYCRDVFPKASITPKLHILENQMFNFLWNWRVGCGLLGEQGAESIHTVYNQLNTVYANIKNCEDRLLQVTSEHHRCTCPDYKRHHRPQLLKNKSYTCKQFTLHIFILPNYCIYAIHIIFITNSTDKYTEVPCNSDSRKKCGTEIT